MRELPIGAGVSTVVDECRRLAEMLRLDAVGVVSPAPDGARTDFFSVQGELSAPVDQILEGRLEGWIVCDLEGGSVFAHTTPHSSIRATSVLRTVAPSLLADATAVREPAPEAHELDRLLPADDEELEEHAEGPVADVAKLARRLLQDPDTGTEDLLSGLRDALGARELFLLVEGESDLEALSAGEDSPRRIPKEIRAGLAGLNPLASVEEATSRQLGVVLGASSGILRAAFCADEGPMEVLLVGWDGGDGLEPSDLRIVARIAGGAREALESRRSSVATLMQRERTRLASEVHDGITQAVTSAVLELEALARKIERDPREALHVLGRSKAEVRRSLSELRTVLFELSSEEPRRTRSEEPLAKYVQDVIERWRLPARVSIEGDLGHVARPVLAAAYVVVRESLANAAKHSSATSVTVSVKASPERVEIEVGDTGRGFRPGTARGKDKAKHFGLEMMRKRVVEVGGNLAIDSSPGKGTRVRVELPARPDRELR